MWSRALASRRLWPGKEGGRALPAGLRSAASAPLPPLRLVPHQPHRTLEMVWHLVRGHGPVRGRTRIRPERDGRVKRAGPAGCKHHMPFTLDESEAMRACDVNNPVCMTCDPAFLSAIGAAHSKEGRRAGQTDTEVEGGAWGRHHLRAPAARAAAGRGRNGAAVRHVTDLGSGILSSVCCIPSCGDQAGGFLGCGRDGSLASIWAFPALCWQGMRGKPKMVEQPCAGKARFLYACSRSFRSRLKHREQAQGGAFLHKRSRAGENLVLCA